MQGIKPNRTKKSLSEIIIQTVEKFIRNHPLCNIAKRAAALVMDRIIPYCDGEQQYYIMVRCEGLQMKKSDYHYITTFLVPAMKLYIRLHKQITTSLLSGSADIERTHRYIRSGKFDREYELLGINEYKKLREIAPIFVQQQASRR